MFPATTRRVAEHTAEEINQRIRRQTEANVRYFAEHPEQIDWRLAELEAEWDMERLLEANAATIAFTGAVLGLTVDRRWLLLPAVVTGFLLQHALQGWCPPVPMFRRLGVRTASEIEAERYALKALRGDFRKAANGTGRSAAERAEDAIDAVST
jgi:hypothetical protein